MTHLTTHNIISPTQYAFRPHSSTTTTLQSVINYIYKQKHNKQPTLAIYIDLSKAYDTVSHSKLIHKLQHEFNFSPNTVQFFRSFFTNRQQSTHTQHAQSHTQTITDGIPQGSTLSTTLFLLYINNIISAVPSSKVYTYADDTTLIITAADIDALEKLAQSELNNLINYFHANNLVPNPKKTQYTVFHLHNPPDIQLLVNNKALEHTKQAKLLGIYMQNNFKHHRTITNIIKKLQPAIQILRHANGYCRHIK